MRLILIPTLFALSLLLTACGSNPELNPLADPRLQPFIATSDMPVPPNVERAASSDQCAGEPLRAINASLPDYPARGWSRGLQGWSIVQFDVTQARAACRAAVSIMRPAARSRTGALPP